MALVQEDDGMDLNRSVIHLVNEAAAIDKYQCHLDDDALRLGRQHLMRRLSYLFLDRTVTLKEESTAEENGCCLGVAASASHITTLMQCYEPAFPRWPS